MIKKILKVIVKNTIAGLILGTIIFKIMVGFPI